jgi:hypothetical protein
MSHGHVATVTNLPWKWQEQMRQQCQQEQREEQSEP